MELTYCILLAGAALSIVFSCKKDVAINADRPQDPWTFRSMLYPISRIERTRSRSPKDSSSSMAIGIA